MENVLEVDRIALGSSAPRLVKVAGISLAIAPGGCTMSETQEWVAGGAALGAVADAALGTSRERAAIDAAVGAASGNICGRHKKKQEVHTDNERLRAENERLRHESGQ